jgi:16S rRNA (guanine966-N2)-methyltransferase
VIAGSARGTRLDSPGPGTRPLGDRVKEALFGILQPDLAGSRVLDLFAGSGAAGIEALSRGARAAVLVDDDARAVRTIGANLGRAGLSASARVVRRDALRWLESAAGEDPFDIAILDPPYAEGDLLRRTLETLGRPDAPLAPHARVVAKHFWRDRPPAVIGLLASERERRFGETALTFYRRLEDGSG